MVTNKSNHTTKMMALLNDRKTYKVLTTNLVPVIEKRPNSFIWKLRQVEIISFSHHKSLQSCDSVLSRIYGLPKIHKTTIPSCPIASFIGSATYHLSKCLKCILSPLVGKTNFTTKNLTEFVRSIEDLSISNLQKQVSFDVVSLFTIIPLDLANQIVFDKLSSDSHLEDCTTLSVPELMEALGICFSSTSHLPTNHVSADI